MSPFGFKGSGERYATALAAFGLVPTGASMLFGRERIELRDRSEGMDTTRDIPYVFGGVLDGVATEVFELKIRTRHNESGRTTEWREERWLVAMADVAERFPRMSVQPRGALGRFFKGIYKGIETGNEAFDKAYHVSCEDRDTALRILHPDLQAWLVAQRPADIRFEVSGACMLVARRDWGPDEAAALLQTLRAFRAQLFGALPQAAVATAAVQPVAAVPEPAPARFCSSCGRSLTSGGRFCGSCGAPAAST